MYDKETKDKAIERVKNGESIKHVAEDMGLSATAVATWCKNANIHSKYHIVHKTDEALIKALKKMKVARESEIANAMGAVSVRVRLRRLVSEGKIKTRRIVKTSRSPIKGYFYKYFNCKLYYLSEDDFIDWIRIKTKGLPKHLRMAYYHFLKSSDINIPKPKPAKKNISISIDLHNMLTSQAKAQNMSIEEFIRRKVVD